MNWDAVGAIAESFGVIGVIFSLIYLAKQIQQSTKQETKSRLETTYLSFADIRKSLIESEELARIFTSGISEPGQEEFISCELLSSGEQ
jgi:hypothetical protein